VWLYCHIMLSQISYNVSDIGYVVKDVSLVIQVVFVEFFLMLL